jgi:hypothetical protein
MLCGVRYVTFVLSAVIDDPALLPEVRAEHHIALTNVP